MVLLAVAIFLISAASFDSGRKENKAILDTRNMTQVGIIVEDIEEAKKMWAGLFGLPVPKTVVAEGHESRPTLYKGKHSSAKAKLAFIWIDNLAIELIEPMGGKSTWQEHLDKYGNSVHHIAFKIEGIDHVIGEFEDYGIPLIQTGGFEGGAYAYMDASEHMGAIIELLVSY